ncbi:MAG: hypothetical protein AAFX87_30195 [Bacteroidota bacterium]
MSKALVNRLTTNPRQIFLIDAIGALVSAFLLGVILVQFEHLFGIPIKTLYLLALIPCIFALLDIYFFFKKPILFKTPLYVIGYLNLGYCCLSIGLAIHHNEVVSYLGWAYIVGEVILVAALALFEIKVGKLSTV